MDISSQLISRSEPMIENNSFLNYTSNDKLFEENYKKDLIFDNKNFDFISNESFNFLQITDNPVSNSESLTILIPNNSNSDSCEKNSDMKDDSIPKDKKTTKNSQHRLLMNKLSARKSRQKKKEYVKCLEEELVKLKNEISFNKKINNQFKDEISQNNNKLFNNIINFEKQKERIYKKGKNDQQKLMEELEPSQKIILTKLLIRQINYFIPLKFQIFEKKYLKLIPLSDDDSISIIISKVNQNLDKIKTYMENISKGKIKLVSKFFEIYKNIKCFVEYSNRSFSENFNY
jgi:hypothetical protein